MRTKYVFVLLSLLVLIASSTICAAAEVSSDHCRTQPSDTTFLGDPNARPGGNAGEPFDTTRHLPLYITRVVGPGTADQFNSDGTLVGSKWNLFTSQQVLSAQAYLSIDAGIHAAFLVPGNLKADVSLNGTRVATIAVSGNASTDVKVRKCYSVDTSQVKFAHLGTGSLTGQAPTVDNGLAGNNDIQVTIMGVLPQTGYKDEIDFVDFTINSISFDAMAPVVLVHGIRDDATGWLPYQNSPDGSYAGKWFNQPFDDVGVPYKAIDFLEDLISPGGHNIAPQIQKVANSFGANHVHLVGHSKGGLWSRAFLGNELQNLSPKLGVFSITTLDTPHHGTYNADIRRLVHDAIHDRRDVVNLTFQQQLLNLAPYSPGTPDLTTWDVEGFNSGNLPGLNALLDSTTVDQRTNTLFYNSISADANLDSSCQGLPSGGACDLSHLPTISFFGQSPLPDESEGYEAPDPVIKLYSRPFNIGQFLYRGMFRFQGAAFVPCRGLHAALILCIVDVPVDTSPQLNDFNVTLTSARYTKFTEIATPFKHNHTTIREMDVGRTVRNKIIRQQVFPK